MLIWLDRPLVIAIHDRELAEHGGSPGVRDDNMLESALARPQQLYAYGEPQPDLADLAATLAFGLARNHPFVDGNKRTAAVACETFIELNGARLQAADADLYVRYLALAEGKLSLKRFADWLRVHIESTPRNKVQEPKKRYKTRRPAKRAKARKR